MAYTKTTWKNNVTDIDENNLNKIEKGIYDNSLVVDAVTNTLNPTDTETYKTAELTEGQITDVIGVKNILIKGQTSQNGEPTPSSPVDINVVSGSNVINIYNNQTLGKELPLDLPVENLMALANSTNTDGGITRVIENGVIKLNGTPQSTSYNNTILTFTATKTGQYMLLPYKSSTNSNIRFIYKINDGSFINNDDNLTMNLTKNDVVTINLRISSTDRINNFTLKPMLYLGTKVNAFYPYGTEPIELCKIGNYQDYFYKSGSKWYLHKEIGKVTLNGNENWEQYSGNNNVFFAVINSSIMPLPKNESLNVFCDNYVSVLSTSSVTTFIDEASSLNYAIGVYVTSSVIRIKDTRYTSVVDLKSWLASNNVTLYYVLATVTNTEITDTTLISQLEAIYNAPLYEQTNITQINNDLPMVLDITACKDNINGIKAFIRK